MLYRVKVAVIFMLFVYAEHAAAIVNVERMRVGSGEEGVSGTLDLTISGKRGNTEQDVYGFAGRLQRKRDTLTDFVMASYDYSKVNGLINTNKSFMHARHIVQYHPRRAWEAFAQWEQNEFTRLSFRGLLGGGLRFTLADIPDKRSICAGAGAFISRETLDERSGLTDQGTETFSRGNFYLAYKEQLNNQVFFINTTYYQPRINGIDDFRFLEQAALAVTMSDSLSLKLSLDIAHDSEPPQTIRKTDTTYNTTLSYSF